MKEDQYETMCYTDDFDVERKRKSEAKNKTGMLIVHESTRQLVNKNTNPLKLPLLYIIKFNNKFALKRYMDRIKNDPTILNIRVIHKATYNADETKFRVMRKTYNV